MDFKQKYFELYSKIADIIEQMQKIQKEFESDYCDNEKDASK